MNELDQPKKLYVVGFMFDVNLQEVVLIKKKRPAWQNGLLNGVGGKVEPNETEFGAMVREFYEEAGVQCQTWAPFARLYYPNAEVVMFTSVGFPEECKQMTDEEIVVLPIWKALGYTTLVPNLVQCIPLALAFQRIRIRKDDEEENQS